LIDRKPGDGGVKSGDGKKWERKGKNKSDFERELAEGAEKEGLTRKRRKHTEVAEG